MAGETTSTNMGLPVPGVGVTAGPTWASDIVASLNIIDAHNHSSGSGVPITPSGLNINADLSFGTNSATALLKASFTSQSAAITGTNFLSFVGGNLYVNDSSGNQIPITSAGGVAGSPGSIGSLSSPAAATYSAGSKLFTWTADSGKAAAMDNGAVTIRETNVASAKGITLASPTSLAADYSLTLPAALPAGDRFAQVSSLGVVSLVTGDTVVSSANPTMTWTPTITSVVGTITTSISVSNYWKIGKLVFYTLYFGITSHTGTPAAVLFTLPIDAAQIGFYSIGSGVFGDGGTSNVGVYVRNNEDVTTGIIETFTGTMATNSLVNIQGFYAIT